MPLVAIDLTAGELDPNVCFTDEQSRFNAYVAAIQSSLPINFTTAIVSASAPGPDDRDKIWIKVDGAGRILGTFLFSNGQWQTIFPTNPTQMPGEIREYDPAFYTPAQSAEECWFPMDGTVAGVADRRGCFVVGGGQRVLPTGSTDTNTNFVAGATGGRETAVLVANNIPAHSHNLKGSAGAFPPVVGPQFCVSDNFGTPTAGYVTGGNTTGTSADGVTPNPPQALITLPPYAVTYWMQWRPDLV